MKPEIWSPPLSVNTRASSPKSAGSIPPPPSQQEAECEAKGALEGSSSKPAVSPRYQYQHPAADTCQIHPGLALGAAPLSDVEMTGGYIRIRSPGSKIQPGMIIKKFYEVKSCFAVN